VNCQVQNRVRWWSMRNLANDMLTVQILDPYSDQAKFGTRYCTGGYIFQILDRVHGELLSGPTYPDSFNWFDGQGIPDAFNLSPLRSTTAEPETALIIGVGLCDMAQNTVSSFCDWEIVEAPNLIRMTTAQRHLDWALTMERSIVLQNRTVTSQTTLSNTGHAPIPMRWFPHPFFPQCSDTDELCKLNTNAYFDESQVYRLLHNGFIARHSWPWQTGHYQALSHDSSAPLVIAQRHPKLGMIQATCSYIPDFFPIWGNAHTFSWEPFLERTIAAGQTVLWSITYDF
jgi:hypothetical protein